MRFKIPGWLQIFLDFTCDLDYQDELIGDLFELYEREEIKQGSRKAQKKFTRRALFSVRWYRIPAFQQIPFIMLFQNFYKVAIRHAVRHRSASSIHALGLILGLGAAFYIGLYLKNELYVDKMHENSAQLYRVLRVDSETGERGLPTSSKHGEKLKETFPFIKMARFGQDPVKIGDQQTLLIEDFYWADSSFFDLFTFEFIAGDPKTCLKEINSLVLTESKAMHLFQSTDIIGRTIKVKVYDSNQEFPMQIQGVVKDPSSHTHIQFSGLGSMANAEKMYAHLVPNWYFSWLRTYIQVPDQRIAEVEAGIPNMINTIFGDEIPKGFGIGLQAFEDIYLYSQDIAKSTLKGSIRNLKIFGAIGLLILLISLLNFINLATARSVTRAKEVGI
ncbi:MAG: ABC transporter permease, partial [Bacteroidota bacterium]